MAAENVVAKITALMCILITACNWLCNVRCCIGVRTTRHIYKLAPNIQTCPIVKSPQCKLAPNTNSPHFVVYNKIQFKLVAFDHRSNVYPALHVMVYTTNGVIGQCYVYSIMSICHRAIDLLLLNAISYSTCSQLTTQVLSDSSLTTLRVQVEVKYHEPR